MACTEVESSYKSLMNLSKIDTVMEFKLINF